MAHKAFSEEIDYVKELNGDELKEDGGRTFVYLRGLERLAKERGIASAMTVRLEPLALSSYQGMYCTYQYLFMDGKLYQGSADATAGNCEGVFGGFLTAMAESRAKARALRTAFGITLCSVEEKSDGITVEESANAPIEDHQVTVVTFVAKQKGLAKADFVGMLEKSFGKKDVKSLTKRQGVEFLAKLNGLKK